MTRWACRLALTLLLVLGCLPATAGAAVTRTQVAPAGQFCDIRGCSNIPARFRLFGTSGPDQVTLSPAGPNAVTVEDPGGVSGCAPVSPTKGVCALGGVESIDLGWGDDSISLAALTAPLPLVRTLRMPVQGGPGDDVIFGSPHADALEGGDGFDRIVAGPGPDRLTGGRDDDLLDGGSGPDSAEYSEAANVDLQRSAPNGPMGQSDRLIAIEGVASGSGGTLAGDAGPNTLIAPGRRLVAGRAGNDVLVGGRLEGGPGNDLLSGFGSVNGLSVGGDVRPRANCGPGRDVVEADEAAPASVTADCERIVHNDYRIALALRRRSGPGVVLRVTRLFCGDTRPCRAKLVLRGGGGVLGSARDRYLNRRGQLALKLSRRGRRALARRSRTNLRIELTVTGSDGFRLRVRSALERR